MDQKKWKDGKWTADRVHDHVLHIRLINTLLLLLVAALVKLP